jgi:hypothetical protein
LFIVYDVKMPFSDVPDCTVADVPQALDRRVGDGDLQAADLDAVDLLVRPEARLRLHVAAARVHQLQALDRLSSCRPRTPG